MYKPALEPRRCVKEVKLIQRRYASKSLQQLPICGNN
jgi:hypothetical protein